MPIIYRYGRFAEFPGVGTAVLHIFGFKCIRIVVYPTHAVRVFYSFDNVSLIVKNYIIFVRNF